MFTVSTKTRARLGVLAVSAYGQLWSGHGPASAQSAATLTLGLVAAWILVLASRPLNGTKALILAGMYAGLVLLFTVPLAQSIVTPRWTSRARSTSSSPGMRTLVNTWPR